MLNDANYELKDNVNGRTPIHAAAFNNNEECLKVISLIVNSKKSTSRLNETYDYYTTSASDDVSSQTSVNAFYNYRLANLKDSQSRTPLMVAVEQGHLNTINFLIHQMGADVFAYDNKNRTALHRAAALGYEECCVSILKADCSSLMQRDLNGLLPIHYAMLAGHANLLFVFFEYYENYLELAQNESDINQSFDSAKPIDRLVDSKGFSLLHFACFNGHSTCTETICDLGENYPFLIEMFTDLDDSIIYNKFTPLHCACYNSHDTCVSILLEKFQDRASAIIELEDKNGNRPLHVCAMNNEYDCALLLIEANCGVNERNVRGHTPFMLAAAFGSFNIMEILIDKVDLKLVDYKGNSALHLALLNNHENSALFILDKIELNSPLINLQNCQGQTPLHLAASKGFLTVVEILLSKGADIWIKNKRQQTPLVCCAKNDQVAECLNLMISLLVSQQQQMQSTNTNNPNLNNKLNGITNKQTNLMMVMMMMTPNQSKTPKSNQNNPIHQRYTNNNEDETNKNDDDSLYALTTSDVILNDVNMNSTNNTNVLLINDNLKMPNTKRDEPVNTNLNSTLINENQNTSISSDTSNTSSRTSSRSASSSTTNNEMEEQEEGELIEDEDEDDNENEDGVGVVRSSSSNTNEDNKLIELVQAKTSPLKSSITKTTNSLFDAEFY